MIWSKKQILIFGAFFVAIIAFFGMSFLGEEIVNYPSSGTRVIAFGDSLVEGAGASPGKSLPDQLSDRLGVSIENFGVSGDTTRDGLVRIDAALEGENPKVVLLLLGGNDFLRKIPREETYNNLATLIQRIQSRGAVVLLLGVRSGVVGGGFDDEFERLSEQYHTAYVEDVLNGVFGRPSLMSDAVHPNAQGYAKIADRIAPVLEKLLR